MTTRRRRATPPGQDQPATPSADVRLIDALAQSAFVVMGALTHIAAEHDLSLTQMRVLGILRDRRPRMAQLADYLGLEKSTLSGLVDRAERRGLLARGPSAEDGRAVEVSMTAAGLELAEQVHAEVRRALAPATAHLTAAERQALTRLLEQMLSPGPSEEDDRPTPARRSSG
jgi:DNA-binding MarR family transcriptional regulator